MSERVEVYSIVTSNDSLDSVRAYLYDHTQIVEHATKKRTNGKEITFVVLKTTSELGDANAKYLRDYQLGRLQSGLYYGRTVDSLQEGSDWVHDAMEKEYRF